MHSNLLGIYPNFVKTQALIPSIGVSNLKEIEAQEGCLQAYDHWQDQPGIYLLVRAAHMCCFYTLQNYF